MSGSSDLESDHESAWKWLTGKWAVSALVLTLLVVALYAEEDWRGAADWKQAQADIAAAGESLDPQKFIPPPIPEETNFGALPIFRVITDPRDPSSSSDIGMDEALVHVSIYGVANAETQRLGSDQLPFPGNWLWEQKPNLPAIQKQLSDICHRDLPHTTIPPQATAFELFELLCPAMADLRAASPSHPDCLFDRDYLSQPPFSRSTVGLTSIMRLSKVLAYDERLALLDSKPQVVLDDLKVGWKITSGSLKEPLVMAGLISHGAATIQLGVAKEGLATHVWNDQQLAELDHDLGTLDFLSAGQFSVRGEAAVYTIPETDYLKVHRLRLQEGLMGGRYAAGPPSGAWELLFSTISLMIPDGWFDQYKADATRFRLLGAITMVDPAARRVFPEKEARVLRLIEDAKGGDYWRKFLQMTSGMSEKYATNFANVQVQFDQARIACRLERYRLVHGKYPASLNELIAVYGADLPYDVLNGKSYVYKPLEDGTFLLYSVGWDQVDDGGKVGSGRYHYYRNDPDWVWENHPHPDPEK